MRRLKLAGQVLGTAVIGTVAYANLPWLIPARKATIEWLGSASLQRIGKSASDTSFSASSLWKDTGCVIMVVRRPG